MARLPTQVEMARWLIDSGRPVEGKRILEVGTGHLPIIPIGFFLTGAAEIVTVDLHPRLDWDLTRESLKWIVQNRGQVESIYDGVVQTQPLRERLDIVRRWADNPRRFCEVANIHYKAPYDAAKTDIATGSIDVHLSVTTLEHIPADVLNGILAEAQRILGKNGTALHFVDPSDHFQHTDKSITKINFLRFGDRTWDFIAGNEFAYCNRLRASDLLGIFKEQGWNLERLETHQDEASHLELESGFPLIDRLRNYAVDDLCTTELKVMLGRSV